GGALVFAGGDGAGELEGAAVEEELFGERRLSRVGVGDDREGAAAGHFGLNAHGRGSRIPGFGERHNESCGLCGHVTVCYGMLRFEKRNVVILLIPASLWNT